MKAVFITLCALCLTLAACDQGGNAQTEDAAAAPQQQEEALPTAPAPEAGASESVTVDESAGSMDESSPAGEVVTEQEIPQSDVPPPSREVFTDAECDFEGWIGKGADEAEAAAKETGRPYRMLTPDSMMTMDHNPERINVVHDAEDKVTRVWCG